MRSVRLAGMAAALGLLSSAAPAAAVPVFTPTTPLFSDVIPEAISVSPDGRTVATSDPDAGIALVDITDPAKPTVKARLAGTQTAVAYTKDGRHLIVVDQQIDRENPRPDDRNLRILNASTLEEVRRFAISSGDMVDVSPDGRYAAIADEQTFGYADGSVIVLDILGREPADWTLRTIALPARDDARYLKPGGVTMNLQPEYVDIRPDNVALVSVQDQNVFAVVDLVSGTVQKLIDAGSTDTTTLVDQYPFMPWDWTRPTQTPRFPDAVAWLPDGKHFLAANEGEKDFVLNGTRVIDEAVANKWGGRGYGVYDAETGALVYDSGLAGERDIAHRGYYSLGDANEAGQQYEGAAVARFGDSLLGFVVAERGNHLNVLDLADPAKPKLAQVLPTGARPEYVVPVPERNLLIASGESGGLSIYKVAAPGEHALVSVVPEDPAFEWLTTWGSFSGNPRTMTYHEGRILFPTDNGVLSVDPDDPTGPNAKTVGSYAADAVPDGAGGWWLRTDMGAVKHVNAGGETLVERADGGVFGGTRIGGRTYNAYYSGVSVYDLASGQSLGDINLDFGPDRYPTFEDTEATAGGDLLFALRTPGEQAVEIYILRDPETVAIGSTVKPELLKKLSLGGFYLRRDLAAPSLRLAVSPEGRVWVGHTHNWFLELDERLPFAADQDAAVGGTVPATLALALGVPAVFEPFVPGVAKTYAASTDATVISTAGNAALSVSEPGHLTNGAFALAQPLEVSFSKATWDGPVSNESVAIAFAQKIAASDPLRTGRYAKTLTFTLSTTNP